MIDQELQRVDVIHINSGSQTAAIRTASGSNKGVDLWEIHPYVRCADGFSCWRYRQADRVEKAVVI